MDQGLFLLSLSVLFIVIVTVDGANITCYQCTRNINVECEPQDLQPCTSISDRCVTHISKSADKGFLIKRECGLGPCGFNDLMMNKGLGFDSCDQSSDEFFCVFCCKENGCNHAAVLFQKPFVTIMLVIIVLFQIFERFQPPYTLENEKDTF